MTDRDYHVEYQLTLDGAPPPPESHALLRVAHVGTWWVATCSCEARSPIMPDRWRVVRWHRGHVRWNETPLDDRLPRP